MARQFYKYSVPIVLMLLMPLIGCTANRGSRAVKLDQSKQVNLPADPTLTSEELMLIDKVVAPLPEELKARFDKAFQAWTADWKANPKAMVSSNTYDARELETYSSLKIMGSEILPLIIKELTKENNFLALVLYDDLQHDESKKIDFTKPEQRKYFRGGEQGRAIHTVKLYLKK